MYVCEMQNAGTFVETLTSKFVMDFYIYQLSKQLVGAQEFPMGVIHASLYIYVYISAEQVAPWWT